MLQNMTCSACGLIKLRRKLVSLLKKRGADQEWNQPHVRIYYRCLLEKMKTKSVTAITAQKCGIFSLVSKQFSNCPTNRTGCLHIAVKFVEEFSLYNLGDLLPNWIPRLRCSLNNNAVC